MDVDTVDVDTDLDTVDADTVPSPCIQRCRMEPETGTCSGCGRTAAEITNWTRMSKDRRRRVLARLGKLPMALPHLPPPSR